jgi:outer membrane protein assembly factor BamD
MRIRTIASAMMTSALFLAALGYSQAQVATATIGVDAQLSDKVLYGQAMWAMEKSKYSEARSLFQTLIDSYPDSYYVPQAKLSIGDAWYAEGSLKQAEMEYRDFVTFFPNRPEAAQTQKKIDSIQKRSGI